MRAQVARERAIRKVAITRSKKGNAALAEKLRARGFQPIAINTIEFLSPDDWSEVDSRLRTLASFDWVVFTSPTGAEFFGSRMRALSLLLPKGKPRVAAVGDQTAEALEAEGVEADFVPSSFLTSALARELPETRGREVLLLRADIGDQKLVSSLEGRGFDVTDVSIYRTRSARKVGDDPGLDAADAILFASPSAVEAFMGREFPPGYNPLSSLAVCIGPVTAAAASKQGFARVATSRVHTTDGLIDALEMAASEGS